MRAIRSSSRALSKRYVEDRYQVVSDFAKCIKHVSLEGDLESVGSSGLSWVEFSSLPTRTAR